MLDFEMRMLVTSRSVLLLQTFVTILVSVACRGADDLRLDAETDARQTERFKRGVSTGDCAAPEYFYDGLKEACVRCQDICRPQALKFCKNNCPEFYEAMLKSTVTSLVASNESPPSLNSLVSSTSTSPSTSSLSSSTTSIHDSDMDTLNSLVSSTSTSPSTSSLSSSTTSIHDSDMDKHLLMMVATIATMTSLFVVLVLLVFVILCLHWRRKHFEISLRSDPEGSMNTCKRSLFNSRESTVGESSTGPLIPNKIGTNDSSSQCLDVEHV